MSAPEPQPRDLDAARYVTIADGTSHYIADVEYAETFDPPTVIALIERVRRAEGVLVQALLALDECDHADVAERLHELAFPEAP